MSAVDARHWYLMILGVDPAHQSRGVGSALLRPVLARADAEGLPCYLQTAREQNLRFYRWHGFEVVREGPLPGDGPMLWGLARAPRVSP